MKQAGGRFAAVLATALAVAPFTGSHVKGQVRLPSEPDLPPDISALGLDKEAFMRARDEYIGLLRGVPHFLPYDPRIRAIRQMEEQELRTPQIDPAFWTQIGPAPIPNGQTIGVTNPVSGRTVAIAVHPTNPNIVYVGAAQGGVYRSLDGGVTWTPIFDNAMSLAIGSVVLAPSNPEILYVGTGEPNGSADSFFGVGLYRIDNASTTANLTGPIDPPVVTGIPGTTAFTGRAISQVLVHPTDPATVFVATYTGTGGNPSNGSVGFTVPPLGLLGLYRSTNATSASPSFTRLTVTTAGSIPPDTSGNRSIRDIVFDPGDPNVLVAWVNGNAAAGDGGLYRTTNALAPSPVFTQVVTALVQNNAPGELTANRVGGVTRMWAATGDTASQGALRRSTDGGATWTAPLTGGVGFCSPQCFYDIAVAAHPTLFNTVHLGGSPNLVQARSTDGGDTFTSFTTGLHVDTHAIEYAPSDPNVMYFGSDGGIWQSTDEGVTWTPRNNTSYHATQFQSAAAHPTDSEFWIGGTQDNGTEYRRANATWTRTDGGDGGYTIIDQNGDLVNLTMYHTYFNQTNAQGFARVQTVAAAEAMAWNGFGCGFGGFTPNGLDCATTSAILFYAPMARGPGNPNTLYFGSDRLYRSTNQGVTMLVVSQNPILSGQPITTIGIAPTDDNARIVGLRNGKVYATTTGSSTLVDVTNPSMPPPNPNDANQRRAVGRAVFDPTNANIAYVTFGGYTVPAGQHVWKTTNLPGGAATWFPAGNGIPDVPVNALAIDPSSPTKLYAGTDIGIYVSVDGGGNWAPYNTGLPRVAVFDLSFFNGASRVLRAATHGRGVWERTPLTVPVELQGIEVK